VTTGRVRGTSPVDGTVHDEPGLEVAAADDGREVAATIAGSAADLDCLLWSRPLVGEVARTGDPVVLATFDAILREGIQ
jgi:hypothetical protein